MKRKFVHNIDRCVGCNACVTSCKNEYQTPPQLNFRKVYSANENPAAPERNFISLACLHCDDPACLNNCPTAAYHKRGDGVVVHDVNLCVGCKLCTAACPYGAPKYDVASGKVYKCQYCYQRLDQGSLPSCVEGCPVGALGMLDLSTMKAATSLGEISVANAVADIPELPPSKITKAEGRFIPRKPAAQTRYTTVA